MPKRISIALMLAVVIAIVALFAASAAYSSCTITIEGKNKNQPGDTLTIEPVFNALGQQYFPCGTEVDGYVYACPDGNINYTVAAWKIESLNNSTLSAMFLTFPKDLLQVDANGQPLNYVTYPSGSHFCPAGDPACFFPSTVYDTLEISFNAAPDRTVVFFELSSTAQVQGSSGQLVASYSGGLYFCEGEFSVPSLATASGLITTEEVKAVTQEYNGQLSTICIKTVKKATEICPPPGQVYYACPPAGGTCDDVADDGWCPFVPVLGPDGKPKKEPATITQYAGHPICPSALVAEPDAAYRICGPGSAYPTCLGGSASTTSTGILGNPCAPPAGKYGCIECVFGGYPQCICW